MGELFAILLIICMSVVLYGLQSPHCPKHKLTPMKKLQEIDISHSLLTTMNEIKKFEVTYQCPKCGEILIREEVR